MAKIPELVSLEPSFSTLQNPIVPQGNESISRIQDPGMVGQAVARLGEEGSEISTSWAERQNMIAAAQARSNLLLTATKAARDAESIPDPDEARQFYNNAVNQSVKQGLSNIPGTAAAQMFQAQAQGDLEWNNRFFDQQLVAKRKQQNLAAYEAQHDQFLDNYSNSADPKVRESLLKNQQQYLTTLRDSGVLSPEEFVKASQKTAYDASVAYYSLHPNELLDDVSKRYGHNPAAAPDMAGIKGAILGQESGNNPNSPTSVNGAVGKEQIIPSTFNQYAKPSESIANPADRSAVFNRIMDDLSQKYNGDPARIAVAYFSGKGNVAPAGSPTPYIRDLKDGNGKSVSSYVQDIQRRLSTQGQYASNDNIQTDAGTISSTGQPIGKPIDHIPQYQAVQMADEALARSQIKRGLQDAALKTQQEQKMNDYLTRMLKGDSITKDLTNDTTLTFEQREHVLTAASNIAKTGGRTDDMLFNRLFQNIHASDNDPDKITDPQTLVPYVGQGLSFEDYSRLSKEIKDSGSPEGKGEGAMKKTLLDAAKNQLILGQGDTDGQQKFGAFQSWFFNAYDKARASGKSADDLLNPDSKDYMGKAVASFDRPQAQRLADATKDPMQYQPPRTSADVLTDVGTGKLTPDQGKAELIHMGQDIVQQIKSGKMSKQEGRAQLIKLGIIAE